MTQQSRTVQLLEQLSVSRDLSDRLGRGRVAIVLPKSAAASGQAQLITTFMVNLVARLYPVVKELHVHLPENVPLACELPRWNDKTLNESVRCFLSELNPPISFQIHTGHPTATYDAIAVVGAYCILPGALFVGGSGWQVKLSTLAPVPVHGTPNSIGAYAGACFAVAEIWKQLLFPYSQFFPGTPIVPLVGDFAFSTFNYRQRTGGPNPDLPQEIDLQRLTAVGLGAGGMAAIYALASLSGLSGHLSLIEPDEATLSNLNRLVAAVEADALDSRPKVDIALALLERFPNLTVDHYRASFDEAREFLAPSDLSRVLAAVHSRAARRSIQSETPGIVWDAAATSTGEFFIWRVLFGQSACLACRLSREDRDPEREKARQLEKCIGQTEAFWLKKICDNDPFSEAEVAVLSLRLKETDNDVVEPARGQRFGDWDAEQCGKLKLPNPDDEVPLPFAPVLAGVLLAGEVLKDVLFPAAALSGSYWNTLLGRFMPGNIPRTPKPRPDCPICSKAAFREQFARRSKNLTR